MDPTLVSSPRPPLAPGLPLLGNASEMSKDLVGFIVEQYKRLGPVFRVRALNQEMVVLAGPEANVFVTQQGQDKFSSRESWYNYGMEFGVADQMQDIDGEPHLRMRKLLKQSYSASTFLADVPLLMAIAEQVIERVQVGTEVETLNFIRLIVTEQLGRVLTNQAPDESLDSVINAVKVSLKVHVNKQSPAFLLRLPSYQRAKRRYLQLGREIVANHRTTTRENPDLVDVLLAAHENEQHQDIIGREEQLTYAALGPFVAGLDTVANECTFLFYELLKHPDILALCVEEADALFAHGIPQAAQLRDHGVLHYAMMETLRLHSIGPVVRRNAAKTFEFAGYRIEQGEAVLLATTAAHFLPELYKDPYAFDITRFSEPRKEHKQRGAYFPFGIGTHLCLGAGAAEVQIVLIIATILHTLRFERVQPEKELRIKIDPTPTLGKHFRIRITQRRHRLALEDTISPQVVTTSVNPQSDTD